MHYKISQKLPQMSLNNKETLTKRKSTKQKETYGTKALTP
jgi:hypothetical protein